ncbi:MAG: NAD(P)/FAD-dependent oxidoreductase [Alphaproteobacteria bacterium]
MQQVDTAIIGGGVVGLACARALAAKGESVVLFEAEARLATRASGRNSQVIHAGMYYPTGSLKARLCVDGAGRLYAYCAENSIPINKLGKLIVAANPAEEAALERLKQQGEINGVEGLQLISGAEAKQWEPNLQCTAALFSPGEGVLDANSFCAALARDILEEGGEIRNSVTVTRITDSYRIHTAEGEVTAARKVINAAGYFAPHVAAMFEGVRAVPKAYFAKGNYFKLTGAAPFSRLIYPLPNEAGLGTHLTLALNGETWFGPDVEWVAHSDNLVVDPARTKNFVRDIRQYYPALEEEKLVPFFAGVRAKIVGPNEPASDFVLQESRDHGLPGVVMLYGIESPGLTASLALAEEVSHRLRDA